MSLRERKKEAARRAILDAANRLIGEHGFDHARMREIARQANVSYQTLYNYFPNKALIVQAILSESVAGYNDRIEAVIANHRDDPIGLLHALTAVRFEAFKDYDRAMWREVATEYFRNTEDIARAFELVGQAIVERLTRTLHAFQERGRLAPDVDEAVMAYTILCMVDIAFLRYIAEPDIDERELRETLHAQYDLLLKPYLR